MQVCKGLEQSLEQLGTWTTHNPYECNRMAARKCTLTVLSFASGEEAEKSALNPGLKLNVGAGSL